MPTLTLTTEQMALTTDPDNINMAERIAKYECLKRGLPLLVDDATGEAMVGLMQAVWSYDPDRGTQFATHATHRIRGAVLDFLRSEVPLGFRRSKQRKGSAPKVRSLDVLAGCDFDGSIVGRRELSHPREWLTVDHREEAEILRREVGDEVAALARRTGITNGEAVLIRLYNDAAPLTMKQTGAELGVSESRVSQIHSLAIANLRQKFNTIDGGREIA